MQHNVSTVDARIRFLLAAGLFILSVAFNDHPIPALGAALVALILAGTGLTRTCPIYRALGISTRERPHTHTPAP